MKSWRVRILSVLGPWRSFPRVPSRAAPGLVLASQTPLPRSRRNPTPLLSTFLLMLLPYTSATADTLRCGSHLIQTGDDAFSVIDKCGQPTNRTTITEPIYATNANGGTYPTGEIGQTEVWRYDRGPQSFPAILKIVDGKVQSIHFVKTPR